MKRWKIVILDGNRFFTDEAELERFRELGELTYFSSTTSDEIVKHIADNEIVLVDEIAISREVIQHCPSIKMIGLFSTGYNHIDIAAANKHGICVCNAPRYSSSAVAQFTVALLLEIFSHVGRFNSDMHTGIWADMLHYSANGIENTEIAGKTVGIIGYGRIGQLFGQIMKAMGATLLVFSRHPKPELEDRNTHFVAIDELYAQSDIISLHCPLNEDSYRLINAASITQMKTGVVLLNTARGAIINESDVADALCAGKIAALGQDVFEIEPIPETSPLLYSPNTYLTPHIGWDSKESRNRLLKIATDNVRCFIEGKPQNIV